MHLRALFPASFLVVIGCGSSTPPPAKITTIEIPAPVHEQDETPPPPPIAKRRAVPLRVVDEEPYGIEVDGHILALGAYRKEVEEVLGPPLRAQDYPLDGTAMAGTTYLSYEDPGMSVRTKKNLVEGFYVYITGAEYEGMVLKPARPVLPRDVPLDATVEQIVEILGEPTKRDAFALMNWVDLRYYRGPALIEYHFDKDKFSTVKVEYARVTSR